MSIQLPLPVIMYVHGIDGDVTEGWERDLEWRTDDTTAAQGESFTYQMRSWERGWKRAGFAKVLARRIVALNSYPSHYRGLHLVGHSQGTDLITLALQYVLADPAVQVCRKLSPSAWVQKVLLYGGAADARFSKNGLNDVMKAGLVDKAFIYTSQSDEILWAASSFWLRGPALGKATREQMGIDPAIADRVLVQECPDYRHCDYFGLYREPTFRDIKRICLGT